MQKLLLIIPELGQRVIELPIILQNISNVINVGRDNSLNKKSLIYNNDNRPLQYV